ncbi:hypothetical protein LXL04_031771 [Taraxacum kok-saghyz]
MERITLSWLLGWRLEPYTQQKSTGGRVFSKLPRLVSMVVYRIPGPISEEGKREDEVVGGTDEAEGCSYSTQTLNMTRSRGNDSPTNFTIYFDHKLKNENKRYRYKKVGTKRHKIKLGCLVGLDSTTNNKM